MSTMTIEKKERRKRLLTGVVVSDRMSKTRVVAVARLKKHPKYHKYYTVTKRYKAHDEDDAYRVGEKVIIEESRPLSRDKRWRIKGFVRKPEPNGERSPEAQP